MKKTLLLAIVLLCSISAVIADANILGFYSNYGWVFLNTSGKSGTYLCQEDGTNCPAGVSGSNISSVTGRNGITGGGSSGALVLSVTSANCTTGEYSRFNGTQFNCFTDQSGGGGGSILGVQSIDRYIIVANSSIVNASLNTSSLANTCSGGEYSRWNGSQFICVNDQTGINPPTYADWLNNWTTSNIGNWTSDRPNYVNYSILNNQNNLSLAQIATNLGNWSNDKASYVTFSILNGQNNFSLAQIASNIGNFSSENSTIVRAGAAQCTGQGVQNITVNSSGVFVQCVSLTGGAGMNNWLLASGNTAGTGTVSDGNTVNITGGNGIGVTRDSLKLQINFTLTDYYPLLTNPLSYYNSTTFTNYYPLLTNPLGYLNISNSLWSGNITRITNLESANVTTNGRIDALNTTKLENNTVVKFTSVNTTTINTTTLFVGSTNLTTGQISEGTNLYFTGTRAADAVINASILRNSTEINATKLYIKNSNPIDFNGTCFNISGATSQWLVC